MVAVGAEAQRHLHQVAWVAGCQVRVTLESQTGFNLWQYEVAVLGAGIMAPPTSTRISASTASTARQPPSLQPVPQHPPSVENRKEDRKVSY